MTSIKSSTLEVDDPAAAPNVYGAAFDLGTRLDVRGSDASTTGVRRRPLGAGLFVVET